MLTVEVPMAVACAWHALAAFWQFGAAFGGVGGGRMCCKGSEAHKHVGNEWTGQEWIKC